MPIKHHKIFIHSTERLKTLIKMLGVSNGEKNAFDFHIRMNLYFIDYLLEEFEQMKIESHIVKANSVIGWELETDAKKMNILLLEEIDILKSKLQARMDSKQSTLII